MWFLVDCSSHFGDTRQISFSLLPVDRHTKKATFEKDLQLCQPAVSTATMLVDFVVS